jgi:hypothetical protein
MMSHEDFNAFYYFIKGGDGLVFPRRLLFGKHGTDIFDGRLAVVRTAIFAAVALESRH